MTVPFSRHAPRCLGLGLILGALGGPSTGRADASPPELTSEQYELMDQVNLATRQGNLAEAAARIQEARDKGDHPSLLLSMGEIRLKQKRCAEARELLLKAEYRDPWAMPGKDAHERHRTSLLDRLHETCPAEVELSCGPGVEPSIGNVPVPCNERTRMTPGLYELKASGVTTRRILLQGAERTTLQLDPAGGSHPKAHWEPTSPQPIPDQNPEKTKYNTDKTLSYIIGGLGITFAGLGSMLLVQSYSKKTNDPGLTAEEQEEQRTLRLQGLSFGWGTVVLGAGMFAGAIAMYPKALPSESAKATPGSTKTQVAVWPVVGNVWGMGAGARW